MRTHLLLPLLLAAFAACSSHTPRDYGLPQAPDPFGLQPLSPVLHVGESVQFSLPGHGATEASWAVIPAGGGAITAGGSFTAALAGTCTVTATLILNPASSASATFTILPALPLAGATPDLAQADGAEQLDPSGIVLNAVVAGEPLQPSTSTSASGTLTVRHGFAPPVRN